VFTFPQITAVQKIVINPRNSSAVYAATSEGVYKSTDAGATWTNVFAEPMAMDLVINPVDTMIVYSSHGNLNSTSNPGIYFTEDAGANWSQLTAGLPAANFGRTALAISPSNPSIIYAGVSNGSSGGMIGLYKSVNGGVDWSLGSTVNYVGSQGWYDNVVAVDPANPNHVYCSGLLLFSSSDGGSTLTITPSGNVHVDHHAIAFYPPNPSVTYFGSDGGIYKTEDGGASYQDLNNGFVTTQFYPGFANAVQDSNVAIGGLQDNGTVLYLGSGFWESVFGGDGGWCAINSTNKNIVYAESQYMNLGRSTNGGFNFTGATSGLPASSATNYNFIPPFVLSYSNPSVLYAGSKNVYKSINGGVSWYAPNGGGNLNGTTISCIGISWTHHDTVMAGTGSGGFGLSPLFEIFASTNGGTGWTNVTGSLPNRYPTDVEFDPTSGTTAYVTYSGYGTPHVFKTTNIGQTWTNISSNLPDIPHQAVTVDPEEPTSLYVGTDLGVFHSSDGGGNWEEFNSGMPTAMILDLTVSRANAALRAATFGNGVYQVKLPRTPTIALNSPNGGEVLVADMNQIIGWTQKYLSSIKLEFSTDNGSSWSTIAENVPASPPQYSWVVPSISTTQGRVRIRDQASGVYTDVSEDAFSILVNPDVISGWNLLSIDQAPPDGRRTVVFPTSTSHAFTYVGNYVQRETLANGTGYWLKFPQAQFTPYAGDPITIDSIDVRAGWNMIGSISTPVPVSSIVQVPPGIVTSFYFGYRLSYATADSIRPKSGYWVKTNADGKLILQSSNTAGKGSPETGPGGADLASITISDQAGHAQTLYLTAGELSPDRYELPPLPPDGVFDVRFETQRFAERMEIGMEKETPIIISSATYPLKIQWRSRSETGPVTLMIDGDALSLLGNGATHILHPISHISLKLPPLSTSEIPQAFALFQNYPNPFNPKTDFGFRIVDFGLVTLKVYDVLGREVATIVNEVLPPGHYSRTWDASGAASGIYLYKMRAGSFSETKKMMLIR
jgi:photosystem II stability/assembly factor-like uncharacterized protein